MIEQLNRGSEFQCVNVGDQLLFEMNKRLEAGKKAAEAFKTHSYVEDEIVIELLQGIINQYEETQTNYIIEGFPRTQRQALALLKMGIIPDKMILLERRDTEVIEYLQKKIKDTKQCKENLRPERQQAQILDLARNALAEYKL